MEYATVYSPPNELQIPDSSTKLPSPNTSQSMSESTISSSSDSLVNSTLSTPSEDNNEIPSDLSASIHDIDSKSSSATITPVTKSFPK